MSVYRISYRYANSLFKLAEEKNTLAKIAEDVELLFSTISNSKELRTLLKNPVIKSDKKKELLTKIFEGKISDDMMRFIDFVIEKNREDILLDIMQEFLNLRDNKEGILRVQVITAVEIDDNLKKEIEKVLENKERKKIKSTYVINPNILGGYVIRFKDTVIDASLTHQLERLRKKFSEDISISNN